MSLFVKAFAVPLAGIRELPGAKRLGGAVYEDDAIEAIIAPAIAGARFGTLGFKTPAEMFGESVALTG
jgi:hypothetical protein